MHPSAGQPWIDQDDDCVVENGKGRVSGPVEFRPMGIRLFGLNFMRGSADDIVAAAVSAGTARPRMIVTANIDHIISLSEDPAFRRAYDGAVARTLDGMPLVWLARLRGARDARRVTGHDILVSALARLRTTQGRVFLVCASERIGEAATARLYRAGCTPEAVVFVVPPMGFESDVAYSAWLAERIRAHGTTLLIVAIGAPKSEIWVDQQGTALGAPLVISVGGALSVVTGLEPRAPLFMQRNGLEWLFRFSQDPRRLFHRFFVRSWRFLALIGTEFSDGPGDPPAKIRSKANPLSSKA